MSRKKIALVGFRLNKGGCGRVMANLSNYLDAQGLNVHVIIFHDDLGYEYSGKLFNLGKFKSKSNSIINKIVRFRKLKRYIDTHEFDCIIDFRFRKNILQELLISKWIYKTKSIYTVHSSRLEVYLPKSKFWTKLIYGNCFRIIAITDQMKEMILKKNPKLSNVELLYNSVNTKLIESKLSENLDFKFDYVLGVGQFETDQKQFDKLIYAYSKSKLIDKNTHLVILGEGKKLDDLKICAKHNNVETHVHFLGFKDNPYKYMKNAKFFVSTSWHEGHPMVLIESLACGIPVISFDCPTGPNEVIEHKENGLLVENQNIESFTESMNLMLEDRVLAKKCKENAEISVEKFDVSNIGEQWINLLNRMI